MCKRGLLAWFCPLSQRTKGGQGLALVPEAFSSFSGTAACHRSCKKVILLWLSLTSTHICIKSTRNQQVLCTDAVLTAVSHEQHCSGCTGTAKCPFQVGKGKHSTAVLSASQEKPSRQFCAEPVKKQVRDPTHCFISACRRLFSSSTFFLLCSSASCFFLRLSSLCRSFF